MTDLRISAEGVAGAAAGLLAYPVDAVGSFAHLIEYRAETL